MKDQIMVSGNPSGWRCASLLQAMINAMKSLKLMPSVVVVVNLNIVDDAEMRRLNYRYRRKRKTTDVLSFEQPPSEMISSHLLFLGDLVICEPVVRSQAEEFGHSVKQELSVLLCHGLLHLLGYDHEQSPAEHRRMAKQEQKILNILQGIKAENPGLIARARVEKS